MVSVSVAPQHSGEAYPPNVAVYPDNVWQTPWLLPDIPSLASPSIVNGGAKIQLFVHSIVIIS
jgi:hypothetical protein